MQGAKQSPHLHHEVGSRRRGPRVDRQSQWLTTQPQQRHPSLSLQPVRQWGPCSRPKLGIAPWLPLGCTAEHVTARTTRVMSDEHETKLTGMVWDEHWSQTIPASQQSSSNRSAPAGGPFVQVEATAARNQAAVRTRRGAHTRTLARAPHPHPHTHTNTHQPWRQ